MRIWTKCVYGPDGRIVEDESEWHEHDGPVAECKGGSTTTVVPSPPTEEERALTLRQIELADFQLQELRKASEQQGLFAEQLLPFFEQQAKAAEEAGARSAELAPLQQEVLDMQLAALRRGPGATPEQLAQIRAMTEAGIAAGETDVNRFEQESLERLREELAPSLGLRPTDTPVIDRGGRVGAEAVRQKGQLASSLRAGEAQAALNFPLAVAQQQQGFGLAQQQLLESTRQFQDQLRQAALQNRLQTADVLSGLGSRLIGNPAATLSSAISPLAAGRGSTSTTTGGGGGFLPFLGGIGGLFSGLGALGFAPFSSKELKEDKSEIDDEAVLEKVERLPVESWRYKSGFGLGEDRHIGPYAEDFRESFGVGDGRTIHIIDSQGVNLAATKALARKVRRLETSFGLSEAA